MGTFGTNRICHVMGTFGTNRIYTVDRVVKVVDRMRFGGSLRVGSIPSVCQMQNSSHVMGTFGTNRIYTVGRVVKVEDL